MTAQISYKILKYLCTIKQINNMNLSVTHAWRKSNVKSVFRINCTKILTNFIVLPNIMHNQTRHTVRDGLR